MNDKEQIAYLLGQINELQACLAESHEEEVDEQHYGDDPAKCSYCRILGEARESLLEHQLKPISYCA